MLHAGATGDIRCNLRECDARDEIKQNLLPNTSFESGELLPESWQAYRPEGTTVRSDTSVFHSGTRSIKITGDAEAKHYPNLSFVMPAAAGEVYYGTVWCKTEAFQKGVGAYPTISFLHQGRRLSWVQGEFIGVQRKDWTLLAAQGTVPDGASQVAFGLVANGPGSAWFDDAEFVRSRRRPSLCRAIPFNCGSRPTRPASSRFSALGCKATSL